MPHRKVHYPSYLLYIQYSVCYPQARPKRKGAPSPSTSDEEDVPRPPRGKSRRVVSSDDEPVRDKRARNRSQKGRELGTALLY